MIDKHRIAFSDQGVVQLERRAKGCRKIHNSAGTALWLQVQQAFDAYPLQHSARHGESAVPVENLLQALLHACTSPFRTIHNS
jgi:hypothetical protein